jgi:hypothetical protein
MKCLLMPGMCKTQTLEVTLISNALYFPPAIHHTHRHKHAGLPAYNLVHTLHLQGTNATQKLLLKAFCFLLGSISPKFYERLFRTKVLRKAFFVLEA